jgi:hypothetical protein
MAFTGEVEVLADHQHGDVTISRASLPGMPVRSAVRGSAPAREHLNDAGPGRDALKHRDLLRFVLRQDL